MEFKLDVFEGPLDLLLHLIQKNKINIYDIPIKLVVDQYFEYLHQADHTDLELSSEFIVVAAQLLQIKSRMLLPKQDSDEEGPDPRDELAHRLLEYQKVKGLAEYLGEHYITQDNMYYKMPDFIESEFIDNSLINVNMDKLIHAFENVFKRTLTYESRSDDTIHEIVHTKRVSIFSKVKQLLRILKEKGNISFDSFFYEMQSKNEVIAGFLAILELLKLDRIFVIEKNGNTTISNARD